MTRMELLCVVSIAAGCTLATPWSAHDCVSILFARSAPSAPLLPDPSHAQALPAARIPSLPRAKPSRASEEALGPATESNKSEPAPKATTLSATEPREVLNEAR